MCASVLFEEVHSLVPSQKYKIKWRDNEYTARFHQHSEHGCVDFINVNRSGFRLPYIRFHSFFDLTIYQPIFQAQQNMELRAVNLILRKILGDPYFQWTEPFHFPKWAPRYN